ncbi:MAG: hypothetical protein M3Q57_06465 [Pseudomonadota bacterium]|nr:hypothetical protein [Pseudomonadota bacterium]
MIEHIILAVLIQLVVVLLSRNWVAGAVAACAWSISREITQAEYRWIEQYGGGLRANMPWWGGLDHRMWQYADPWLDWLVPSLAALAVAVAAKAFRESRASEVAGPL